MFLSNKQCEKSTINYQQNNQESKVIEAKLINELPITIHRIVFISSILTCSFPEKFSTGIGAHFPRSEGVQIIVAVDSKDCDLPILVWLQVK